MVAVACITAEELPAYNFCTFLREIIARIFSLRLSSRVKIKKEFTYAFRRTFRDSRDIKCLHLSARDRRSTWLPIASIYTLCIISRGRCAVLFPFRCEQKAESNYPLLARAHALSLPKGLRAPRPPGEFIEPTRVAANSCSHLARST